MTTFFICDRQFDDPDDYKRWLLNMELLMSLCHELVIWINKILPNERITLDTFFMNLQDGVVLCRLANALVDYTNSTNQKPRLKNLKKIIFSSHSKCFDDKSQFISRSNVALFIQWCKENEIHNSVLFEANDCVELDRTGRKEIIICLWQLARKFKSFDAPLPSMIQYEMDNNSSETDMLATYLKYKSEKKIDIDIDELVKKHVKNETPDYITKKNETSECITKKNETKTYNIFKELAPLPEVYPVQIKNMPRAKTFFPETQIFQSEMVASQSKEYPNISNPKKLDDLDDMLQENKELYTKINMENTSYKINVSKPGSSHYENRRGYEIPKKPTPFPSPTESLSPVDKNSGNSSQKTNIHEDKIRFPIVYSNEENNDNNKSEVQLLDSQFNKSLSNETNNSNCIYTSNKANQSMQKTTSQINLAYGQNEEKSRSKMSAITNALYINILNYYMTSKTIPLGDHKLIIYDKCYLMRKINKMLVVRVGGGWEKLNIFIARRFIYYLKKGIELQENNCCIVATGHNAHECEEVNQIIKDTFKDVIYHIGPGL